MSVDRLWLDVPFGQKDEAKALGARWDPDAKRWFAPRPNMTRLQRWAPLPEVPDLLPGEDREFGSGLFVDLVPRTCWFTNVRSCVDQRDWERLRRMLLRRAGQRCEACDRGEDREVPRWLEAHERWSYDTATRTQTLRRLVCLCTDCHIATHMGLAEVQGQGGQAITHLCAVTGMTSGQARAHVDAAFSTWRARSATHWRLDLRMLTDAGITLASPPGAADRARQASERLDEVRAAETSSRPAATPETTRPISSPPARPGAPPPFAGSPARPSTPGGTRASDRLLVRVYRRLINPRR